MTSRRTNRFLLLFLCVFFALTSEIFSQSRIAVLPFRNMNGDLKYSEQCYKLSDSISAALKAIESGKTFVIVPSDEVDATLASLNLNPSNPQYESDMWKAVEMLKVEKVISGVFQVAYEKMIINTYIYDVKTKLPDAQVQSRNIRKEYAKTMEAVPIIVEKLKTGL